MTESDDEWWIEGIAVPKSSRPTVTTDRPTYRRGWTFTLEGEMRFVSIPFTREDGTPAIAIALRGATDDYFAGWFDAARAPEVEHIVSHLNAELDAERTRHARPDSNALPANDQPELVLEIGSEYAPDSRFGLQRVQLKPDGTIHYEHANRGERRAATGRVDPSLWTTVTASLSHTSFPAPPQASLPPGGGIVSIVVAGPRSGQVLLDYYDALEMHGYREVVGKLVDLCNALRTDDREKLQQLSYEGPAAA